MIPTPRVNHAAVLDNNAKIIVFGGYTVIFFNFLINIFIQNDGYSNDVYFIDINNERFEKPILSGNLPSGRESFSMNIVSLAINILIKKHLNS
jgi:Kelch motif